jgi:hypothetical protein
MAGNVAGMVGGQMSVPSVPQAAMGGQVNYPQGLRKNMGNMPIFARGGMTEAPTEINVEKGELLVDPKTGKILTEYKGGGMVPHPEYGMDERGTVPAQEGKFVIPVKYKMGGMTYAERYKKAWKENDQDLMNALKNNTAYRKAKKEAKEEAEASKMMAKYGGAIQRMMARGGMVPMYDGGSNVVGPLEQFRVDRGYFNFDNTFPSPDATYGSFNTMQNPLPGIANYIGKFNTPTAPYNVPGGVYPNQAPYAIESADSWRTGPTNPVTDFSNYLSTQQVNASIQPMQPRGISQVPVSPIDMSIKQGPGSKIYTKMPGAGGDMSNFGNQLETAAMLGPGLYNLGMGLFSKPEKFDKLKLSGQLKSYETPYQTDYAPYNATKYALRQAGQSSPAALSQLFATFSKQEAANRLANREQNLRRQMAADQFNLSRADQVAQTNLAIDQLNAQQRAARRSMIGEGISNIGQVAAYNKGMRQDKDVLGDLYKNYEFKDGKWAYKG